VRTPRYLPLLIASLAAGCGGGSPTDPSKPTPTAGSAVSGFVYYDENANGVADPAEVVRLPGVSVTIGGQTAGTTAGGRFTVANVPAGQQSASALPQTLPAYFTPGVPQTISVPTSSDVPIPAVLPLRGRARANVYLAFGDSITWGDGSSDLSGYRSYLQADLRAVWGKAVVEGDGVPATKSDEGERRVGGSLATHRPGYLLILYGTNDWNESRCRDWFPCFTIDALRSMVHQARAAGAEPLLGTIPPVNPDYVDRNAGARNDWVKRMNDQIRAMAREEQVSIAEVHGDFLKQPSLPALFADDKHPNNEGYRVMSRSFFDAITKPYPTSSSSLGSTLFAFPARRR
jgi:lysophospholipase L1-like esterase